MIKMNRLATTAIAAIPAPVLKFMSHNQWRVPALRRVFAWGASLVKDHDGVIAHGVGQGLRFNVASSHSAFILGNHEIEVQKLLAEVLRPGMIYYDVGANVGFFATIAARLLGPTGKVICFEPLPENARQIEYNARLNGFSNILVRREALGSSNRTETFHTSSEPTWGMLSTVGKLPEKVSGQITVDVRTLDSLRHEAGLPRPDVIKMDIEGAEADALTGAMATLTADRPLLVIELHRTNGAVTEILDKLAYDSAVLGRSIPVRDATWDANIVAVPQERQDLTKLSERSAVT